MRGLLQIILIAVGSFLLGYFLNNWWLFAVCSFAVSIFFKGKGFISFLKGFIGVALAWGLYALYINLKNEGVLSDRMFQLVTSTVEGGMGWIMILITALVGGIIGGLAAMAGNYGRRLIVDDKPGNRRRRKNRRRKSKYL